MTRQQKFVAVLESRGLAIVKRGKYIVMGHKNFVAKSGKPKFFYVGKAGSLRVGINQASSKVVSDSYKKELCDLIERGCYERDI